METIEQNTQLQKLGTRNNYKIYLMRKLVTANTETKNKWTKKSWITIWKFSELEKLVTTGQRNDQEKFITSRQSIELEKLGTEHNGSEC